MRISFVVSGPERIDDYQSFRSGIVEPDYQAFLRDQGDLRLGLHSATSLFHLSDWIWVSHESYIKSTFQWLQGGILIPVTNRAEFSNAIADQHPNFENVRAMANAAKHLTLYAASATRPLPPNRPSHAANTYVEFTTNWIGWPRGTVMLQGPGGADVPLIDILGSTRTFWDNLMVVHGW
jgi:hypothetical protein